MNKDKEKPPVAVQLLLLKNFLSIAENRVYACERGLIFQSNGKSYGVARWPVERKRAN